jgi:hypothetical protein
MIPVLTDDGVRLLIIIFRSRSFVMVADHSTIFTIYRRDMLLGITAAKDAHVRSSKLDTYAVMTA